MSSDLIPVSKGNTVTSAAWMLWPSTDSHTMPLPRLIDRTLASYRLYPESEWMTYGYRPPEDGALLGSWRDARATVFIFLLAPTKTGRKSGTLNLHVSGEQNAIEQVGAAVRSLKTSLEKLEKRDLKAKLADTRIQQEKRSPAFSRFMYFLILFTAVVNGFSLYLRRLPAPNALQPSIQEAYLGTLLLVHFSSLFLLLVTIWVGTIYMVRYGLLMLGRL
jgi:hypothetical protein